MPTTPQPEKPMLDLYQASELMRWFSIGLGVVIAYNLYRAATKGRRY
jgi:hypothetical protein